jgi:Domain of unknown function (DUF6471)
MEDEISSSKLAEKATRLIKVELARANLTHEALAARLTKMGFPETAGSVKNKLSRGAFSAVFFLAVLKAVGRRTLNLEDI